VVAYRIYEIASDGSLTSLAQVSSSIFSYAHVGLTVGTLHTYIVRAINGTGQTDGNSVSKSAFTYGGVTGASASGLTTATVTFGASGASTTGVKIYASARGAAYVQVATATSSATSASVTGLYSGTSYTFKVLAQSVYGTEDTNSATATVQTTSNTSTKYKGPLLVQAYGDAPNAPSGTPTAKQVSITWLGFLSSTSGTQYTLVRTGKGNSLDMSTTTACTNTTTTSCRVCNPTGAGAQTCTDTAVAAAPQQYDYAVTQYAAASWPEELPASDSAYRITVPIPPNNMVLVHRAAANYEQCALMSRTTDPLNHQRCVYSGLGAAAYNSNPDNSALALAGGYFDMGYSFFVDRWVAACNWTPAATTGMCGAGATSGNCFGNTAPASTIGTVGNVYYRTDTAECFYKRTVGAAWLTANNSSLLSAERALMMTIDPGAAGNNKKPPMAVIDQNRSWDTCQTSNDSNYGAKRLLRQREYRAMAAWQAINGEPNALSDAVIDGMENGSTYAHSAGNYSCNSSSHSGLTAGAFTTTEMAGDAGDAIKSMTIGSLATSKCVSRFGAQDHVGNVYQWVSDQMSCNNITHTCSGTGSALDSGNGYSSGYDMNGFLFNGTQGPGSTGAGQVAAGYTDVFGLTTGTVGGTGAAQGYGAGYFNTTLGLPLVGTDSGYAKLGSSFTAKFHGDYFYLYTSNGTASRGLIVGGYWGISGPSGRWLSYWYYAPSGTSSLIGFRCALPAE
jgi:hypothetical protein